MTDYIEIPASEKAGRWMKKQRLEKHLSQEDLAELLGCDVRTIRRYQHKISDIDVLFELAEKLDCDWRTAF